MQKKIGNVILDYSFYPGEDKYTDGEIEDDILAAFREHRSEEMLRSSRQWPILYHISDIRENLLEWYPFNEDADLLEVGAGCGALTGLFSRRVKMVTCIELSEKRSIINAERNKDRNNIEIKIGNFEDIVLDKKYDYITLIGVWEYAGLYVSGGESYVSMIRKVKEYLKPNGKIIVAIENKMGMKYFNGAVEDHTAQMYSGINDYVGERKVRTFSKPEIENILKEAEIDNTVFYYPLADYKIPDVIYSDWILPKAGEIRYYKQEYSDCRVYNFYDATAFDQICNDRMFDYFSNSFLFICGEQEPDIAFAKYNRMRKRQYRTKTVIKKEKNAYKVIKSPLNTDAAVHVANMKSNEEKWSGILDRIECVHGEVVNGCYEVPYLEGVSADVSLYRYRHSAKQMIDNVRKLIGEYLSPAETKKIPFVQTEAFVKIFGEGPHCAGYSLPVTNVDLIFSNLVIGRNGTVSNFDYEWVFDFPVPYEYVLWRSVYQLYDKYAVYLLPQIAKDEFLTQAGIERTNIPMYKRMEKKFGEYVCGERGCEKYITNYEKAVCMQNIQFK